MHGPNRESTGTAAAVICMGWCMDVGEQGRWLALWRELVVEDCRGASGERDYLVRACKVVGIGRVTSVEVQGGRMAQISEGSPLYRAAFKLSPIYEQLFH
jgi:hypothetical protein